jgi:predicted DNA-binding protein with PD1-like motif
MEYLESKDLIFIRLHQDDELFDRLREVCVACDVKVGVVLSGIGMLKQAELNFFKKQGEYSQVLLPEPLELVSLTGNIIFQDGEHVFHLHVVLARPNKDAVAGHLSKGKVNVTNEIVILKSDAPLRRELDPATGLMSLRLE